MGVSYDTVSSTIKNNPLDFSPICLLPFSGKLLECVLYTSSPFALLLFASEPSLNRILFPPLQTAVLVNFTSALKTTTSSRQCPWSTFYWPASSFWQLSLSFWRGFVHMTCRTPHLPGFPGCYTDHLVYCLPQSLLPVPPHLPTSKHWSPPDLFLGTLFFSVYTICMVLSSLYSLHG